jgi:hypothetical protein
MENYNPEYMNNPAAHLKGYTDYYDGADETEDFDNEVPDENAVREPEE